MSQRAHDALGLALLHDAIHKAEGREVGPDEDGIYLGLTGPDWEPGEDEAYYASRAGKIAFGPNALAARRNLLKEADNGQDT